MREELGDFISIRCVKAMIAGIEKSMGERASAIAMRAAGRERGKQLGAIRENSQGKLSLDDLTTRIRQILGKEGTRLCFVEQITRGENIYLVYVKEIICSGSELEGAKSFCTYTNGVIQGLLEVFLGEKLFPKQIESVLNYCHQEVLEFTVIP